MTTVTERPTFYHADPHPERQDERHVAGPLDRLIPGAIVIAGSKYYWSSEYPHYAYSLRAVRILKVMEAYPDSNKGFAEWEFVSCVCGRMAHYEVGGIWLCSICSEYQSIKERA